MALRSRRRLLLKEGAAAQPLARRGTTRGRVRTLSCGARGHARSVRALSGGVLERAPRICSRAPRADTHRPPTLHPRRQDPLAGIDERDGVYSFAVNFLKLTPAQQEAARKKAARKAQNANGANDVTIGRYFNLLMEYDAYCKEHARVQPFPITAAPAADAEDERSSCGARAAALRALPRCAPLTDIERKAPPRGAQQQRRACCGAAPPRPPRLLRMRRMSTAAAARAPPRCARCRAARRSRNGAAALPRRRAPLLTRCAACLSHGRTAVPQRLRVCVMYLMSCL